MQIITQRIYVSAGVVRMSVAGLRVFYSAEQNFRTLASGLDKE